MTRHMDGLSTACSGMDHARRLVLGGRRRRWWACMTAFLLASAAVGQSPPTTQPAAREGATTKRPGGPIVLATKGSQLRATIQTDEVSAEEVVVSVGTSTVLDMNLPVSRVEVARPEVAEVEKQLREHLAQWQSATSGEGKQALISRAPRRET